MNAKTTPIVSGSPHIHNDESTRRIMWSVVIALLPALLVSVFYFGLPALFLTLLSVGSCVLFEFLIGRFLLKQKNVTVTDGSAVITGLLLAFNVPANLSPWLIVLGDLVAIGLVKMTFGGLGKNLFNPALTGRVFLLISFPAQMTTWPTAHPIWNFSFSDAVTGPTPLAILKEGVKNGQSVESLMHDAQMPDYLQMLVGQMGGSFGEISAIALLIGAVFLWLRKVITWHIPVSFIASAGVLSGIFWLADPTRFATPWFHLLSGGLLLGAFFMATDYVTSPMSKRGMVVYGCGCGCLTILIRAFGSYPEGVSFAILFMNAIVPLINKTLRPKTFA